MEDKLRKSVKDSRIRGPVFSFVPAHGESRAGAVAEQLSRTLTEGLGDAVLLADFRSHPHPVWFEDEAVQPSGAAACGAIVTERDGIDVLEAPDVNPRELAPLLQNTRENYVITCVDLTGAREDQTQEVLRVSEAIFIVAGSARASLEGVRETLASIQGIEDVGDRCALLLLRDSGGVNAADAEEITGLPLCSLVDSPEHIAQFARWLATNATQPAELALAG